MKRTRVSSRVGALMIGVAFAMLCNASAYAQDASELAHLVENPIAELISVPFQDNLTFGVGPRSDPLNVLNIQPVVPLRVNNDWNVISRTIVPVVSEPQLAPGGDRTGGLGDISLALYLSPAKTSPSFIWGVGPALTFPSATNKILGQGKFSAGMSAVALTIKGHWLIGTLVTDVGSIAGESYRKDVHQMLVQPFVNYNFSRGWYLVSSPIITSNWEARSGQQWTLPMGGGGGRTFRVGRQALNAYVQAFGNVEKPHDAGNWTLRAQLQLLFPK
jgi:hypothetical protein